MAYSPCGNATDSMVHEEPLTQAKKSSNVARQINIKNSVDRSYAKPRQIDKRKAKHKQ